MDWIAIAAIGAIAIGLFNLFIGAFKQSLSIREHDEYRHGMDRTTDALKDQFRHDIERLESQLARLDDTRPTAGELKTTADGFKEQLAKLEARLKP